MRATRVLRVGALAPVVLLSACGGGAQTGTTQTLDSGAGNPTDRAFVAAMVPHHQSAIEMARIAEKRGQSRFVQSLAADIERSQSEEIGAMREIDQNLASAGIEGGDLRVPEHMRGMKGDVASLNSAEPFDAAFVEMMIPHHEGAIEMAAIEVERGRNGELIEIARSISEAQAREIDEMNKFLEQEGGSDEASSTVPHGPSH